MPTTTFNMKFSIIIPTYNRADELAATLRDMGRLGCTDDWEVVVADNNSHDHTKEVVAAAATNFPAPLRYCFEPRQGRSAALNAGIRAARGEVILTTDDDVRVQRDWLDAAASALESLGCDYVGGKVLPAWKGTRPGWLPDHGGRHWAVIALLDYGDTPLELGSRAPLGVNMAFRRECFERAGLWNNSVGRKAGTLLGQEVREWGLRARAAGLRGYYAPDMVLYHVIPADRLTKHYFRRWFYWHGISRALLYEQAAINMEAPEETPLDRTRVPHIFGVPRYLYRSFASMIAAMFAAGMRRDKVACFENELWLWFFAGIVRQRWIDRNKPEAIESRLARAAETER